ncbi:MAG TPA: ATP-binding protein [Thermoanaerobaculia bacterium]|nr:ATP-binding protein [Thermoanaerobaculia bacterium]
MTRIGSSRLVPALAGLITLLIGAVPVAGWLLGRPAWIQLHPSLTPIALTTAAGLILCGLAMTLAAFRVAVAFVRIAGIVIFLAASWTLGELVMGVAPLVELPRFPGGRGGAPPNAALAFLLTGLGLACIEQRRFLVAALGAFVSSLGGVALLGHLAGIDPALAWGARHHMSLTATVGFTILGAGMWAHSRHFEADSRREESWRRPILGGLATLAGTLLFWQALSTYEGRQLRQTIDWAAGQIAAEAEALLEGEVRSLSALAPGIPAPDDPEPWAQWRRRAELLTTGQPGLRALAWMDRNGVIEPTQPEGWPSRSLADLRQNDPSLRRRLQLALGSRRPLLYGPISLEAGTLSFWYFSPADRLGEPGIIAALYDSRALLEGALSNVAPDYEIFVTSGDTELYRRRAQGPAPPAVLTSRAPLVIAEGDVWTLGVLPSRAVLAQHESRLGLVILVVGGALALVLTASLYLRQVAVAQAATLGRTNARLRQQVDRSIAAERKIRSLNEELERRVSERTEELRRSNDDLRQFASFASHELRQPLGTLVVWLDLLKNTQGSTLTEEGKRYVREMEVEARRMRDLIETQLKWAAASAEELHPDWVELSDVVDELEHDLATSLLESGGRLEAGPLPVVRADRQQLYNVLRNLVENSIKYRREDVPLVVRIEARDSMRDDWARPIACEIVVADNGQGFAPEEAETIFQLFERLQQRKAEGSGVGLAICRRLVERLGGEIRAEGSPGEGAAFIIALPEARVGEGALDQDARRAAAAQSEAENTQEPARPRVQEGPARAPAEDASRPIS